MWGAGTATGEGRPGAARFMSDGFAISIILVLILNLALHHHLFDDWLGSTDRIAFFIPMYSFLGDSLRNLDVPGWNPYVASGAPFAGDPESGWMYFPAMLTFTLLRPELAYKAMMVVQLLVAAFALYPLGRLLGLHSLPALVTTTLFTFGSFAFQHTGGATVATQVSTWLPAAFLGVELALRVRTWPRRLASMGLAGVAISQMLTGWPGQGAAYTLLMVGGWVAYRGVLDPRWRSRSWLERLVSTTITGVAVLGISLAISAAAMLPRLAVNAQSNNPGGTYEGVPGSVPGTPYPLWRLLRNILSNDIAYRTVSLSGVMLALMIFAVLLARRRNCAPFFIGLVAATALLSMQPTVIHRLVYLLVPTFEGLHAHDPKRIFWVAPLGAAVLAGIGLQHLDRVEAMRRPHLWCWLPLIVVAVLDLFLNAVGQWFGWGTYVTVALVCAVANLAFAPPAAVRRTVSTGRIVQIAAVAVLLLSLWFPMGRDIVWTRTQPYGEPGTIQPWHSTAQIQNGVAQTLSRTDPGGAGEFLQRQQENLQPFRYTSYAGYGLPDDGSFVFTRFRPQVLGQLLNGRSIRLGLEFTNGYNPMQLQNYAEYLTVMNGRVQNYHFSNVMYAGLDSRLFDMLGVRYIIVDARVPAGRDDYVGIATRHEEVFRNQYVVVFENVRAYPRAWIVHDVRPNNDGRGLALINSGDLNGHITAVVDGAVPPIRRPGRVIGQEPPRITGSTATVLGRGPERTTIRAEAAADGLLVTSEIYEEGWVAYVDGERTDVVRTNHVFQGVPLTAGEHTVELRYESRPLAIGLWVSGAALAAVLAATGWLAVSELPALRRWVRSRRSGRDAAVPAPTAPGVPEPARSTGYTGGGP